ncbi:MAG TPA: adenylate/guanylate cyclase domain-containing protein [Gaiellaceae bacterium]
MPACPVCGHENAEDARFCSSCGAPLTFEARREERKVVSVLFADLVGFTSRAEQLDPEDVRAVLAPYWARLRAELERYGGTVEKFIGDAVMALFGAPVTREDDPERAVRAALAIRDWAREAGDLQVRIAVTTGEALVLLDARPSEGEGMASGDVVNTAARLQAAAPVNGVLVSEATYRATRDVIDYEEREPVVAKGKTEPVRVWEAIHARSRLGMDLDQRALLPLVGRLRELDALVGAFERASEALEPQLVTLVGVPGIGKSRLVAELFQRIEALPDIVLWRQGRALPYGEGVSFWALSEMVKAQAGIQENDSLDVAREKLWASVEGIGGDTDHAWLMRQLLPLIGGEPPRGESREESFAAWRTYFEGIAEERPLVLVFEDLHWADDGLLDFVDHVADWASGVPLFVVGTARPELLDRRPGWGGGKLNATTLALSPLADAEAAQIIARVLEQALLSADTQQALLERAGGNPLYAEQFARLYVERGSAEDLPLPETIQGIIAARLDGLSANEKRLLQDAAVLGKVFWSGGAALLAALDSRALTQTVHSLERKGLVRRERRSSVSGEEEYAFRHVLVRDVAYGQIPRAERGTKHVAAARWIEGLGRADDHAELVAHHYTAALELARAAGTTDASLEGDARSAFVRAGDRSYRLGAFPSALRFYTDALELPAGEAERALVRFAYARARLHAEGDRSDLAAACDALAAAGETDAAAEAAALAANAAWRARRSAEAEELLTRALTEGWGHAASAGRAALLAEQARFAAFVGRLDEADAAAADALAVAERLALDELRATVLNTRGVIALQRGDLRRARAEIESALAVDASMSEQIRGITNLAVTWDTDLFVGEGTRYGRLANDMSRRMGNKLMLIWAEAGEIAEDVFSGGDWDGTLERGHAYLAETAEIGGGYSDAGIRLLCAYVHAARGDEAAADAELETALGSIDAGGGIQGVAPTLMVAARIRQILGRHEPARELVDQVLSALRQASIRAPGLRADMAIAFYDAGRGEEWLELARTRFSETGRVWMGRLICSGRLTDAAELLSHIARPHEEAVTRLAAAEQLLAAGSRAEAGAQLDLALPYFERAGATRIVAQAESLFAAAS